MLLALLAIFAAAKLFGELAERIGQPAVLGEMVGGVVIGGHLKSDESQVIPGAAVVDDILGHVLLSVVSTMAAGQQLTVIGVGKTFGIAFGFVVRAIVVGSVLAPRLIALITRLRVAKALFFASIMFAFALAYLAEAVGSAVIIGAFAAGLVLASTDRGREIEHEVYDVAQFFIPIFFVSVGAAVDLEALNPFAAVRGQTLRGQGLVFGPLLALTGAACAAGSLAVARRSERATVPGGSNRR